MIVNITRQLLSISASVCYGNNNHRLTASFPSGLVTPVRNLKRCELGWYLVAFSGTLPKSGQRGILTSGAGAMQIEFSGSTV